MDRKEKQEIRRKIGSQINLGNGRFKDDEYVKLNDLVENRDKYNGLSKTHRRSFDGWSSDGKYTREEENKYTFRSDKNGIRIDHDYHYQDDDGQSGSNHWEESTARGILSVLHELFK